MKNSESLITKAFEKKEKIDKGKIRRSVEAQVKEEEREMRENLLAEHRKKAAAKLAKENDQIEKAEKRREEREERKSKKEQLIDIILDNTKLFNDQYNEPFAAIQFEDHREVWPVRSKSFKRWISKMFWNKTRKAVSGDILRDTLNVIEGIACFDNPKIELHNRITWHKGSLYYDLSDKKWQAVRISGDGWKIVENPPILFRRYAHQKAQAEPVKASVEQYEHLLFKYINLKDNDEKTLVSPTIPTFFISDIPKPGVVPYGPAGSTKTTALRVMKELVDPSNVKDLSFPRDHHELVQQVSHHYFCNYDNISYLPDWISDALCRFITGSGFSKRELYSNDEDVIYAFIRCIALNGINIVPRNPDLLERSILLGLEIPHRYIPEKKFWKMFKKDKPKILGGLFTVLSKMLRMRNPNPPDNVRMSDYCQWGEAAARVLGYGKGVFTSTYLRNAEVRNIEALEAHKIGPVVLALMERVGEWEGKPSKLLDKLEEIAAEEKINTKSKGWPKAPHALTRRLNELKVNLESVGIKFESSRSKDRTLRVWRIPSEASEASKPTGEKDSEKDAIDAIDAKSLTRRGLDDKLKKWKESEVRDQELHFDHLRNRFKFTEEDMTKLLKDGIVFEPSPKIYRLV